LATDPIDREDECRGRRRMAIGVLDAGLAGALLLTYARLGEREA
jgi:hypothetical protein